MLPRHSVRLLVTLSFVFPLRSPHVVAAQTLSGAATITPRDIARHLGVIAHDSMLGRYTPSPGLEMTAAYVAQQFATFGLAPGAQGSWIQRYPITVRQEDAAGSSVRLRAGGRTVDLPLGRDALRLTGSTARPIEGPVRLIGGPVDAARLASLDVTGAIVLFIPGAMPRIPQTAIGLARRGARAVLLLSTRSDQEFGAARARQGRPQASLGAGDAPAAPVVLELRTEAIAPLLGAAGVDLAAVRSNGVVLQRDLPGLHATIEVRETLLPAESAPNTVGLLEGSDPILKNEYIVFSAHMDHIGIRPGQADSIANGADDDASGTVGILELAQAFASLPIRPKRSLIFLTVSGEERGLWGSQWFAEHPPVPIDRIVADLNIDMIGRNWPDSIVAIGKEHSDLGATLERINAQHPELRMTAIDDRWPEQNFYQRSDHFNFARRGVPILFFFNGVHEDYHRVSDEVSKIDTEKMSRIVKLVFYLGDEIARTKARPRWNPASRARIVQDPE